MIGAHVGPRTVAADAEACGAEVVQIFTGNPRGWAPPADDPAADERLRATCADRGLPLFVHAPYLINLGSPDPDTARRSTAALTYTLCRAADLGAAGVVVHAGSAVHSDRDDEGRQRVRARLLPLLDAVDPAPRVLIEPTAGGGGALAWSLSSIATYFAALDHDPRLALCLDTCHLHAAGHDLSTPRGVARTFAAAGRIAPIGLVHANDSRDPAGSRRDRHTAIGTGTIGVEPFGALFRSPALRGVPIVVEGPPVNRGPDIAVLKRLRDGPP